MSTDCIATIAEPGTCNATRIYCLAAAYIITDSSESYLQPRRKTTIIDKVNKWFLSLHLGRCILQAS